MTIAEPDSRRAILSVEPLEGRAAPGGWGGWGGSWDRWSNWSNRSYSWSDNSQERSSSDDDSGGGWRRHGGWSDWGRSGSDEGRSSWSSSDRGCGGRAETPPPPADCPKPPPPPCQQPPTTTPSQLGGIVYQDDNRDGVFEPGEPLLGGVTVTLTGTNRAGQAVSVTVSTNENGGYAFNALDAGTYSVRATSPVGLLTGHSAAGVFGGTPADNAVNDIPVPTGQTSAGYNVGFEVPRPR